MTPEQINTFMGLDFIQPTSPCRYCGYDDLGVLCYETHDGAEILSWFVNCDKCGAQGPEQETRQRAIAAHELVGQMKERGFPVFQPFRDKGTCPKDEEGGRVTNPVKIRG